MTIIYNTKGKTLIKTVVKLDKVNNRLELFYLDEYDQIVSFCYAEGHSIACKKYLYSLSHVDKETAEAFILAYNNHDKGNILHVYSKHLIKRRK